ncbi:MAG: hypothetical protein C4539_16445 [Ignavibacteriales bacterium]|nr:MAG: hypothetical protein C4539_16445 [Ignavibacteriales bacterium]
MILNKKIIKAFLISVCVSLPTFAQTAEQGTAITKLGKIWTGVAASGDKATFDFTLGFFPNDYDILQYRGQYNDNYNGSGFLLGCTDWLGPKDPNDQTALNDSLYSAVVFGPKNDFLINGKVTDPIKSYTRYKYAKMFIDGKTATPTDYTVYDPTKFEGGTYDQVIQATYKNVLGVDVKRRILGWGQSFNDNYLIIEVELTNNGYTRKTIDGQDTVYIDTLRNFYFSMQQGVANNYYSNGRNPSVSSSDRPNYTYVWQHYYGGREEELAKDSLRIFYFYSADDPSLAGDNMGSPALSQKGRLLNTNFTFYTILHASKEPYVNSSEDIDDALQPRVTYIGNETKIPNPGTGEDEYGSKNYWAMRGGYSDRYPMPGRIEGTHHGINNDELGKADFSDFPAGTRQSVNSKNFASFGPYTFPPNHKIQIVYAVGIAGIGLQKSKEVGEKWFNGTLTNPDNMPDANTGWLPSNFVFPDGVTEQDKIKDRWISMGIDSVMISCKRAKWNFKHGYNIPAAPPPPDTFAITGYGDKGVELRWSDPAAESMDNFAGYRIMRRISATDTVFYQEIYSSDANDKASVHTFYDRTILYGGQYYYFIQAKAYISENDLNADPTTRGKIIYSGRTWVPNVKEIYPPGFSYEDMSRIRIVPNPYNINDPLLRDYGYTDLRGINFFNLPKVCTIKIFTENGDLVQTIEHSSPNFAAGSETWDMITKNQQVINSGVYIAVFEKPDGSMSYQKFIVIR